MASAYEVQLTEIRSLPDTAPLACDVEFLEHVLSSRDLPLFTTTFRNLVDDTSVLIQHGWTLMVPPLSVPGGLAVITGAERAKIRSHWVEDDTPAGVAHEGVKADPTGCLTIEWVMRPGGGSPTRVSLSPGTSREITFGMVGHTGENDEFDCPPPGEYEFSSSYTLTVCTHDVEDLEFDWGFSVRLE